MDSMRAELIDKIVHLLKEANPECYITSYDVGEDIFSSRFQIAPRDLVYVCMKLGDQYSLDYKKLANEIDVISLNTLSSVISEK